MEHRPTRHIPTANGISQSDTLPVTNGPIVGTGGSAAVKNGPDADKNGPDADKNGPDAVKNGPGPGADRKSLKPKRDYHESDCNVKLNKSPFSQMLDAVSAKFQSMGIWSEEMHRDLPKKWEKHGSLILLPENCFTLPQWRMCGRELWKIVAESMHAERLGRKKRIAADDYRTPHIELLYGPDGWVEHVDNAISYQYDVTKTMFSIGNINEKLRIAAFDCNRDIVVDMFCGIGYFTLPYLVHAKAHHVHAMDWNPDAIEALRRNLKRNKVEDRCTVYEGDCRKVCPQFVADRVNLGLIPTCRHYWLIGCKALSPKGGTLHIHENVTTSKAPTKAKKPPPIGANTKVDKAVVNGMKEEKMEVVPSATDQTNGEYVDKVEDTNGKLTNGIGLEACATPSPPLSLDEPPKRKPSRSASILEELESRPIPEPTVDKKFEEETWNKLDSSYKVFALEAASKCSKFLNNIHEDRTFSTTILRVGKIKGYAPHIDHVVLDLVFKPDKFYK